MSIVNISEARRQFSRLVDQAAAGKEVVISRNGKPVARLVGIQKKQKRMIGFGALKGKGWIADDFDAPLPDEILVQVDGR